jgi:hypothetical protein
VVPHHPRLGARMPGDVAAPDAGRPVTPEALEAILARATVPILRQLEERQPDAVVALLPSLVRTMLAALVEIMAEQRLSKA